MVLAVGTYVGNHYFGKQGWGGQNLTGLVQNLALAGLGGAVSRLGAASWTSWMKDSVLTGFPDDFMESGAHLASSRKFSPFTFATIAGPALVNNTVHAFTTPDFILCPDQRDGEC